MMHSRSGYHVQVIDGQGGLASAKAGAAALAVTGHVMQDAHSCADQCARHPADLFAGLDR